VWYYQLVETLLKADIFFFISSLSTIVLTIFVCVLLFYLNRAAKNLHKILEGLKSNFEDSEEFVGELRERLENNLVFRMFFPPVVVKQRSKAKGGKIKKNEKQNNK
jgi:hypothetical protein